MRVTMFSDFICPFCYIGFETIRKLAPEFSIDLDWRGFQIHPDWPAEGIQTERIYTSDESRRAMWNRIQTLAGEAGLEINPPNVLTNSYRALEAAELARDRGLLEPFAARVFRAYFQEGANIGDSAVIRGLAGDVGIEPAQFDDALKSGKYALKLKNNALIAGQRQVSGVPTFFIGEFSIVGAQSPTVMSQLLTRARERLEILQPAES